MPGRAEAGASASPLIGSTSLPRELPEGAKKTSNTYAYTGVDASNDARLVKRKGEFNMKKLHTAVALSIVLAVGAVASSFAADPPFSGGGGPAVSNASVAFVPFKLQTNNGIGGKLDPTLKGVFEALGFRVVIGIPVIDAIRACCGDATAAAGAAGFPYLPADAMTRIGRRLGVRYVICGDMTLMSDRSWYGRASADATLHTIVVDVHTGTTTYTSNVTTDSK